MPRAAGVGLVIAIVVSDNDTPGEPLLSTPFFESTASDLDLALRGVEAPAWAAPVARLRLRAIEDGRRNDPLALAVR